MVHETQYIRSQLDVEIRYDVRLFEVRWVPGETYVKFVCKTLLVPLISQFLEQLNHLRKDCLNSF